ncbi:MBL fold metallo-hydrolase [Alienimonas californiensis]|uniref:Hydroxyacylglutathione hydrolase n=1 Tax=Alienimonas californiensis TaxID=2527989 RepID=A0A517PDD6_9PLAN|nr:MBL fold metallo-hydrolase [Alienimonas californiensis]QDT17393.1 hydroxyacylglutathione hydrolase [Alienimonas californiensis]
MQPRRDVFPHVLELNNQAGRRLGCAVYVVHDGADWLMIDVGYEDTVAEVIDIVRSVDLPLANCRYLVATHADADHVQGLAAAKALLPNAEVIGHPHTKAVLEADDRITSYALIPAQGIDEPMPQVAFDRTINEGDTLQVGSQTLTVWSTPGHTDGQLSFRMNDLLFSGDNIYRDGGVGNIDAHHGSELPAFIRSLERIRDCDAKWLLPSHGPIFRNDPKILQGAIDRLKGYLHLSDFGTCAIDWPLLEEWDDELARGFDAERAA